MTKSSISLWEAARRAGLRPIPWRDAGRKRGRPNGSKDSYDRWAARKDRLELHAELMRELYGGQTMAEYDSERDKLLERMVLENEALRRRSRI